MSSVIINSKQLLSLVLMILVAACSTPQNIEQSSSSTSTTPLASVSWKAQNTFELKTGPSSVVSVHVNGKCTQILANSSVEFVEIPLGDWQSQDVPEKAVFALYGWWAGYGEALYALQNMDHLEIYWREAAEGETPPKFELIEKISLK